MDFSLPTNSGTTMCGKMMTSRKGSKGNFLTFGVFSDIAPPALNLGPSMSTYCTHRLNTILPKVWILVKKKA